ncbi:hypothetical protein [Micromonospora sp. NPDC005652]|uniref:hypothetical protein n=1 Tax=Micromonospora sp. NPDC005652 TaxID=3157046 RepID=UPI003406EF7D
MIANLQVLVEPTGPADDAPMIPRTYQGGLPPAPHKPFDLLGQIGDAFALLPQMGTFTWIVIAAALITAVNAALARRTRDRLRANRAERAAGKPADERSPERVLVDKYTNVLGGFGAFASLAGTLYALRHEAGDSIFIWATLVLTAALVELTLFVLVLRAKENARETGSGGLEGKAIWVIAVAIGLVLFLEPGQIGFRVLRLFVPLLVAFVNHLRIRAHCKDSKVKSDTQGPLEIIWRRVLVFLRLAERADLTLSEQDKRVRVARFAWVSYRAEKAPFTWQRAIARWRMDRQLVALQERYGNEIYAEAALKVAALTQAREQMHAAATTPLTLFAIQQPTGSGSGQSGTGNVGGSGSDSADSGSGKTGSGSDNRTGSGSENSRGSGSAKPAGTSSKLTVREVEDVRATWSTSEHAARLDYDTARAHAAEIGREVFASTGQAKAGMRAYYVVMAAANHEVKGGQMREDVTGQKDTNGQGRNLARTWKAELAADADAGEAATAKAGNADRNTSK